MGATNLTNGQGNLLIGYMEPQDGQLAGYRTGSHNIVVGRWNIYYPIAFGSIIGGEGNGIFGECEVVFGAHNAAQGQVATILGGSGNTAPATSAVVVGGFVNAANVD
jgi:hypothetical protein